MSADGLRQDFLLTTRPRGLGPLRLGLLVRGAHVQGKGSGAELTLIHSSRKIAYNKLTVTDADARPLEARFEILSTDRLGVVVDDSSATYPLRIDPTFSDSNWVDSWGQEFGATVSSYANNANNDGTVRSVVADGSGNIYIGGGFTKAGGTTVNRIAKWNGSSWSALGSGMDAVVLSLAISGSDLYAGGDFTTAGGTTVNRIAKWNGSDWSAVGTGTGMEDGGLGFGAQVRALAFHGSDLYAAGDFVTADGTTVKRVAKWNGSTWSGLGSGIGGNSAEVYALAFIGDDLYVGGSFSTAGGDNMSNIAKWSTVDNVWSSIGGADGTVDALAVSGSDLYVGGGFSAVNTSVSANRIAKWSTTASDWSSLSGGVNGRVTSIQVSGTDVYFGGMFQQAFNGLSSVTVNYIAVWSTTANSWSALGSGMSTSLSGEWSTPYIYALTTSSGQLYAVGNFLSAGSSEAHRLARWDGSQWRGFFEASNGVSLAHQYVSAIALVGSDVYVGGFFTLIGGTLANNIAKWNGSSWSALGSGTDQEVFALAAVGAELYVGGDFSSVDGSSANYVAKYNGSAWSPLGSGTDGSVYSLAVSGGDLFAGGSFSSAGGVSASSIAKYNGSTWSALGSGVDGTVRALAVSGTSLYVGGSFTTASGLPSSRIAKWHLTINRWSALGLGVDDTVWALAANNSEVFLGGAFLNAGGRPANHVARWNGSAWSALGSGVNATVYALALSGVTLYAGGGFTTADGSAASYIANWNGSAWSAIGSGTAGDNATTWGDINCLTTTGTSLYVGGYFATAGSHSAGRIAKLTWSQTFEVASSPSFTRAKGTPLRIPVSSLASDLSGASLTVTAVGSSAQGATVTFNSAFILYSPANDSADSFTYTVSNGSSSLSGSVDVETEYFPGTTKSLTVSGGSVTVTFLGIPGHHYDVQRATALSGQITWSTLTITPNDDYPEGITAGADGSFSFTDSTPPEGTAFYRCIQVFQGGDRYGG